LAISSTSAAAWDMARSYSSIAAWRCRAPS
jgi:hypothetical protein